MLPDITIHAHRVQVGFQGRHVPDYGQPESPGPARLLCLRVPQGLQVQPHAAQPRGVLAAPVARPWGHDEWHTYYELYELFPVVIRSFLSFVE